MVVDVFFFSRVFIIFILVDFIVKKRIGIGIFEVLGFVFFFNNKFKVFFIFFCLKVEIKEINNL